MSQDSFKKYVMDNWDKYGAEINRLARSYNKADDSRLRSPIDDIWKEVNRSSNPSPTSLEAEARKYKSAEEFVKAQGTPVYHGTNAKFDTFDPAKINTVEKAGDYAGAGFYFTKSRARAEKYASQAVSRKGGDANIMEVYLDIKKPLVIKSPSDAKKLWDSFGGEDAYFELEASDPFAIQQELVKRGYDGVIDEDYGQIVAFSKDQIKTRDQLKSIWEKAQK